MLLKEQRNVKMKSVFLFFRSWFRVHFWKRSRSMLSRSYQKFTKSILNVSTTIYSHEHRFHFYFNHPFRHFSFPPYRFLFLLPGLSFTRIHSYTHKTIKQNERNIKKKCTQNEMEWEKPYHSQRLWYKATATFMVYAFFFIVEILIILPLSKYTRSFLVFFFFHHFLINRKHVTN